MSIPTFQCTVRWGRRKNPWLWFAQAFMGAKASFVLAVKRHSGPHRKPPSHHEISRALDMVKWWYHSTVTFHSLRGFPIGFRRRTSRKNANYCGIEIVWYCSIVAGSSLSL